MKIVEFPFTKNLKELEEVENFSLKLSNKNREHIELSGNSFKDEEKIYNSFFEFFKKEKVFLIGSNISSSYLTTRAFFDFVQNKGEEPCLIVFDSHLSLMDFPKKEIFRKESWLRNLIEDGFETKNILLVGIRKVEKEEEETFSKIRRVSIEELMFDLEIKMDAIMEFSKGRELYVSFDMGFVDPAYAPAVDSCEPGGLSSKEVLYIVKRLAKMRNIRAFELRGINPLKDFNEITLQLSSKILEIFSRE